MQPETGSGRMAGVQPLPLIELLRCPRATENLLNNAALRIDVEGSQVVFRQLEVCRGLYLVISGQFMRRTERLATRIKLGVARAGELVELAAALGDGHHTYTLTAQICGSLVLLPTESLNLALEGYPPLRMRLLEELAREVSRGYSASCQNKTPQTRQYGPGSLAA